MGFRHWQGTVREQAVAWKCPSCGAENTGPLAGGCAGCKAGADGQKVAEPQRAVENPLPSPIVVRQPAEPSGRQLILNRAHTAFDDWYRGPEDHRESAWKAFIAGVTWAADFDPEKDSGLVPPATPVAAAAPPKEPYMLALVDPVKHESSLMDGPTQATVVAALEFYLNNQLAYGAIPGQLSAEDARKLLELLQPEGTV